jgi:type I restriction enzyme M protein
LDSLATKLKNRHEITHYQNSTEKDKVFFITHRDIKQTEDLILIPSYYNGFLNQQEVKSNQLVLTFREIIDYGIIEVNKNKNIPTGDEIGSRNYLESGTIPFIRTSDITNLEIRSNPQHFTSEEIYQKYKDKQDIKPYDILLVKDGRHLVGECAIIMPEEERIIFAAGFYKIRVIKNNYGIDT